MTREVLFRGKRVDNGEWIYGYYFKIWDKTYILWGTTNDVPNMYEVIPETVGQFTGLYDKNGVKIFEGDVIQHYAFPKGDTSSIEFDNEEGWLGHGCPSEWKDCEVIGNIHDKELSK